MNADQVAIISPLLIFILVVLFIAGGLLLLRDTAFLKGKPADTNKRQRDGGGDASSGASAGQAKTDKNADSHDADSSNDGGGDGGGGD